MSTVNPGPSSHDLPLPIRDEILENELDRVADWPSVPSALARNQLSFLVYSQAGESCCDREGRKTDKNLIGG